MGGKGGKKKEVEANNVDNSAGQGDGASDEGPVLTSLSKRLRASRKKLRRIEELEQEAATGKSLTAEQEAVVKGRPGLVAVIDELEKFSSLLKEAVKEEVALVTEKIKKEANDAIEVAKAEAAAAVAAAEEAAAALAAQQVPDVEAVEEAKEEEKPIDTEPAVEEAKIDAPEEKPSGDLSVSEGICKLLQLLYFSQLFERPWDQLSQQERRACVTYNFSVALQGEPLSEQDLMILGRFGRMLTIRPPTELISHKASLEESLNLTLKFLEKQPEIVKELGVTTEWLMERLERVTASDYYTVVPQKVSYLQPNLEQQGMVPPMEGQQPPLPFQGSAPEQGRPPMPHPVGLPDDPAIFASKRQGQPVTAAGPGSAPGAQQNLPPMPFALQNLLHTLSSGSLGQPPAGGPQPQPPLPPPQAPPAGQQQFSAPADLPPTSFGNSITFGTMDSKVGGGPPPPRGDAPPPPQQGGPRHHGPPGHAQMPVHSGPPGGGPALQHPSPSVAAGLPEPSAPPAPPSMLAAAEMNGGMAPRHAPQPGPRHAPPQAPLGSPPGPPASLPPGMMAAVPPPPSGPGPSAPSPPPAMAPMPGPGPAGMPAPGVVPVPIGQVPPSSHLGMEVPSFVPRMGMGAPPPYGMAAPFYPQSGMHEPRPFDGQRGRGGRNPHRGPPPQRAPGASRGGGRADGDFVRRDNWAPGPPGPPGPDAMAQPPRDGFQAGRDGYQGGGRRGGRGGAGRGPNPPINGHMPPVTAQHLS